MRYERTSVLTAWLVVVLVAAGGLKAAPKPPSQDDATATFTDGGARIRSDGNLVYVGGADCVVAWVDTNASGFFFFRTVGINCYIPPDPTVRSLVLDFGQPVGAPPNPCLVDDAFGQGGGTTVFPDKLNICSVNTLPDVRLIASSLFHSSALAGGTPVTLRVNLAPDFRYTAFELQFEQSVPVTEPVAGTRVMTAGPTRVAELYKVNKKGPKSSLGRFYMPFQLTVTR